MKMYSIKKGTLGIVLNGRGHSVLNYHTTKDLEFFDTVTDPVRFANQQAEAEGPFEELAEKGYAVFAAEDREIFLAVPYNQVEVMA